MRVTENFPTTSDSDKTADGAVDAPVSSDNLQTTQGKAGDPQTVIAEQAVPQDVQQALGDQGGEDWRIELDAYAGPLDLLLYLVKRHEIDLNDIPMARLTEQYVRHVKELKNMDVDRAADFLLMAATLLEIKSRMILPSLPASTLGEEDDQPLDDGVLREHTVDPRLALVQQLLEYKKFKDAAWALQNRQEEFENRFVGHGKRPKVKLEKPQDLKLELDLDSINMYDLHAAFGRLIESVGFSGDHRVQYDDTPIAVHAQDIENYMRELANTNKQLMTRGMSLRELFAGRANRSEMIGIFLATLELIRNHIVSIQINPDIEGDVQGNPDAIQLVLRPAEDQQHDHDTSDASQSNKAEHVTDYDFPDEETRIRALRRARLRAMLIAKAEAEEEGRRFNKTGWKREWNAKYNLAPNASAKNDGEEEEDDISEDELSEEAAYLSDLLEEEPEEDIPDVPELHELKLTKSERMAEEDWSGDGAAGESADKPIGEADSSADDQHSPGE